MNTEREIRDVMLDNEFRKKAPLKYEILGNLIMKSI